MNTNMYFLLIMGVKYSISVVNRTNVSVLPV